MTNNHYTEPERYSGRKEKREMTKSEIKKGLYMCSTDCSLECPYFSKREKLCINALMSDALEVIEKQDTELNTIYNNIWGIINERTIF